MAKHYKILILGLISGFVALTTAYLGIAGTIIGSVLSSVFYNVLSELVSKPLDKYNFEKKIEGEVVYAFPLIIIAIVQLIFLGAILAEFGVLPYSMLNIYLSIQHIFGNNLYRILGIGLFIMSIYPIFLKTKYVKKDDGYLLFFVSIFFLLKGFSDLNTSITNFYGPLLNRISFFIGLICFLILVYVILNLIRGIFEGFTFQKRRKYKNLDDLELINANKNRKEKYYSKPALKKKGRNIKKYDSRKYNKDSNNINAPADDIEFISNDLLDNYKK